MSAAWYRITVSHPSVCVILPVLNEFDAIDACLGSLAEQDYPGPLEVFVAEGGSTDGTVERLSAWRDRFAGIRIINNADRVQSIGMWLAALATDSEILVRADAHTTYEPDYVSRSVDALLDDPAIAVGGAMRPASDVPFGRAVSRAMVHPLGIGPAPLHRTASERRYVTNVYLGAFRRDDFLAAGGMRTLPSLVAEDADMYHRWDAAGEKILLDPGIRSTYTPRSSPSALWRQFYRYGLGKADMWLINRRLPSYRPLGPLALMAGLLMGLALVPVTPWPLVGLGSVWIGTLVVAMKFDLSVALAGAIMHLSYGLGLVRGLLRRPSTVRAAVRENVLV